MPVKSSTPEAIRRKPRAGRSSLGREIAIGLVLVRCGLRETGPARDAQGLDQPHGRRQTRQAQNRLFPRHGWPLECVLAHRAQYQNPGS